MLTGGKDLEACQGAETSTKAALSPGAACLLPATQTVSGGVLPSLDYRAAKKTSPTRRK